MKTMNKTRIVAAILVAILIFLTLPLDLVLTVQAGYASNEWSNWTELPINPGASISGNYKVSSSRKIQASSEIGRASCRERV